uniref:Uncharacterized protein n=1 Tax=Eutreptiella gymnastica TaxID=73025 RepID=A0A7S1NNM9_9EUGL
MPLRACKKRWEWESADYNLNTNDSPTPNTLVVPLQPCTGSIDTQTSFHLVPIAPNRAPPFNTVSCLKPSPAPSLSFDFKCPTRIAFPCTPSLLKVACIPSSPRAHSVRIIFAQLPRLFFHRRRSLPIPHPPP